ncbi:MAG: TadE/TadG family type IV pilus assembly protein [Anaerolineales bacterium]|jgi:Flp pilus assembly protein TadG
MNERVRELLQGGFEKCNSIVRGRQRHAGQGLVEFAIALPVVMLVIFGTIEFGRFMITNTAISSASREAARFGAAVGNDDLGILPPYEDCLGIRDAAKRITTALIPIDDSEIDIQYDKGPGTTVYSDCSSLSQTVELGDRVVVSITTTYEPLIPLGFGNFEVTSVAKRSIAKGIVVD